MATSVWPVLVHKDMKILALNGGGMRGFVAAQILAKAENTIGASLSTKVDLVAGVSTGSLIGACIGLGIPCTQVSMLYRELQPRVFGKPRGLFRWLLNSKYDTERLVEVLKTQLSHPLGSVNTDFMLYAYRISGERCGLKFWKSWRDDDKELPLWQVAAASCCAPTYFQPLVVDDAYYLDGGMAVNNPSLCALAEAVRRGADLNTVSMLHLGWTPPDGMKHPEKFTGLINAVPSLPSLMIDATDDSVRYQGQQLLGDRYITIGSRPDGSADVDIDSNDWPRMIDYANRLWDQHGQRILDFLKD